MASNSNPKLPPHVVGPQTRGFSFQSEELDELGCDLHGMCRLKINRLNDRPLENDDGVLTRMAPLCSVGGSNHVGKVICLACQPMKRAEEVLKQVTFHSLHCLPPESSSKPKRKKVKGKFPPEPKGKVSILEPASCWRYYHTEDPVEATTVHHMVSM